MQRYFPELAVICIRRQLYTNTKSFVACQFPQIVPSDFAMKQINLLWFKSFIKNLFLRKLWVYTSTVLDP